MIITAQKIWLRASGFLAFSIVVVIAACKVLYVRPMLLIIHILIAQIHAIFMGDIFLSKCHVPDDVTDILGKYPVPILCEMHSIVRH